jgi:hypothetical protein
MLIKAQHPTWHLPTLTVEGTIGADINQDSQLDDYLSKISDLWNELFQGPFGDILAQLLGYLLLVKLL